MNEKLFTSVYTSFTFEDIMNAKCLFGNKKSTH
jgi:hypothetical protein